MRGGSLRHGPGPDSGSHAGPGHRSPDGSGPWPDEGPGRAGGPLPGLAARLRGALLPLARELAGARCLTCREATHGPGLCPDCARELAPRLSGFCPGCGELAEAADMAPAVCGRCRVSPRPWAALGFHGEYKGALRQAVLHLKFGGRLAGLTLLGDLAWHAYLLHRERPDGFHPDGPDLVTAVPMHWRRLLTRGYNQSLELARFVAGNLGAPLAPGALRKVRHTTPQSRLGARERRANLDGAFAAEATLVDGRRVLLVDDVMTTGSTLESAARALLRAGAARVEVLVAARD